MNNHVSTANKYFSHEVTYFQMKQYIFEANNYFLGEIILSKQGRAILNILAFEATSNNENICQFLGPHNVGKRTFLGTYVYT